jgi:DNA-binding transcriptional MocR family regulator
MTRQTDYQQSHTTSIRLERNSDRPLYEQLAEALAASIGDGSLAPGDRLPPHRELARALRINITTVTRAIALLKERGLVEGRGGRGTLVGPIHRQREAQFQSAPVAEQGFLDLGVNRPATDLYLSALAALMPQLPQDERFASVKDYQPSEGPAWARVALERWLESQGIEVEAANLVLTAGVQHGLASVLRAITQPGDVILADSVTYQGINALCRTLGIDLRGVLGDVRGMLPERFEQSCRALRPRAAFLVPSLHNPTTITLGEQRRRELVDIAARHDVLIIEDDVYRSLLDDAPASLQALYPERTFYLSGLSKCIAPGLRFGFVAAPEAFADDVATALRVDCWSVEPLSALIATHLFESGQAGRIIEAQKRELRARDTILSEYLGTHQLASHPTSTHAWLHLPEPWRGSTFALTCREHGVGVLPGEAFTLRQETPPHAVRLNLSAARSRDELRHALGVIAELAASGHRHESDTV